MKELFQRFSTPIAGALSSISFKGIADISQKTPEVVETVQALPPDHPSMFTYFWIGVLGGIGGLAVKILWSCVKRWIPKFKNIDK